MALRIILISLGLVCAFVLQGCASKEKGLGIKERTRYYLSNVSGRMYALPEEKAFLLKHLDEVGNSVSSEEDNVSAGAILFLTSEHRVTETDDDIFSRCLDSDTIGPQTQFGCTNFAWTKSLEEGLTLEIKKKLWQIAENEANSMFNEVPSITWKTLERLDRAKFLEIAEIELKRKKHEGSSEKLLSDLLSEVPART